MAGSTHSVFFDRVGIQIRNANLFRNKLNFAHFRFTLSFSKYEALILLRTFSHGFRKFIKAFSSLKVSSRSSKLHYYMRGMRCDLFLFCIDLFLTVNPGDEVSEL